MKAITRLILFVALVSLSACSVEVAPEPGSGPNVVEPDISNGFVETDFQATLEGEGEPQFVICQEKTTELTYTFTYTGDLNRWTSYLRGENSEEIKGRESFDLSSNKIQRDGNTITVTYTIPAGQAPLLTDGDLETQAIIVVPAPKVLGETQLFLEVEGFSGLEPELLSADSIPVIENCPQEVDVTESSYMTDRFVTSDSGNNYYICNNLATNVDFTFTFTGELETLNVYYTGTESGNQLGPVVYEGALLEGSLDDEEPGIFEGKLEFGPNNQAPRLVADDEPVLSTQGIVVTPTVVGSTTISVQPNGEGDIIPLDFEIPVSETCVE